MEPKLLNLPFQLRVVRLQGRALGLEPLYLSRQLSIEWMVFRPFSGDGLDVLFVPLQGPFAVPRVHETLPTGLRPPGRGVVMVRNSGSLCLPGLRPMDGLQGAFSQRWQLAPFLLQDPPAPCV